MAVQRNRPLRSYKGAPFLREYRRLVSQADRIVCRLPALREFSMDLQFLPRLTSQLGNPLNDSKAVDVLRDESEISRPIRSSPGGLHNIL